MVFSIILFNLKQFEKKFKPKEPVIDGLFWLSINKDAKNDALFL
jgi:hypothetical protein